MKKLLSIILTIFLFSCCAFSFSACKKNIDSSSVVNPRAETIKVGVIDYAPLNYMYRNTFLGFNTELAILTFEALGYNVQFVEIEPSGSNKTVNAEDVYSALENGNVHCFWGALTDGVLFDETRADFSYKYLENSLCLVKNSYSSPVVQDLSDLEGKKVAVGEFSTAEKFFVDNLSDIATKETCERGQTSALHQLNVNKVNYAIVDSLLAFYYIENDEEYSMIKLNVSFNPEEIPYEFSQKNYCRVVFPKSIGEPNELRDNVNLMFETFSKTGVLTKLSEKNNYRFFKNNVITDFSNQK